MGIKIGFISDLHYMSYSQPQVIKEAVKDIAETLDYVVIAGDISSNIHDTLSFIKDIPNARFIPGNHDLYRVRGMNSKEIYEEYLNSPQCLITNPLRVGNTIVLGDIGWYDYSTQTGEWTEEEVERKRYKGHTWVDKIYFNWPDKNDRQLAWYFNERLDRQLAKYKDREIIAVTHIVPFDEFVIRKNDNTWDYFGAFIGCKALGKLYQQHNVRTVVFGHTHFRMDENLNGIHCLCRPLGMTWEWKTSDVIKEISSAIYVKEVDGGEETV